jgi:hypothetical protein
MAWQREVRRPSTSHVHRGPKNKTARRLVFVAAATVAGLILILALLRVPAVQLQILRWVAGGADGAWRFDVQRVSVGPGGGGNLVDYGRVLIEGAKAAEPLPSTPPLSGAR